MKENSFSLCTIFYRTFVTQNLKNDVHKIQKAHKIYSIRERKFKATTNSKHNYPVAVNLLNQDFHVEEPNKVWVTDISYIGRDEGWLYLATVKDLFDLTSVIIHFIFTFWILIV
jgi:transposase InsO family protein